MTTSPSIKVFIKKLHDYFKKNYLLKMMDDDDDNNKNLARKIFFENISIINKK